MIKLLSNLLANLYYKDGCFLLDLGETHKAIQRLSKAISKNPNLEDAYLKRSIAYYLIGENQLALSDLTLIISRNPDNLPSYYWRSRVYLAMSEIEFAFQDADKTVIRNPTEPANYLLRSYLYFRKHQKQQALDDINTAIGLGFEKDGINNRALMFEEEGDYTSAINDWTKLIQIEQSESGYYYCRRGIAYAEIGEKELAIADLEYGLKIGNLKKDFKEISEKSLNTLLNKAEL